MADNRKDLSLYRLQRADLELQAAGIMLEKGIYIKALSSSYYAMFHAVRAVCAMASFDSKKHSGIISFFDKNFVAVGAFDRRYSRSLHQAFNIRQDSDYEDFYVASCEEAKIQVTNAHEFIIAVRNYLDQPGNKE